MSRFIIFILMTTLICAGLTYTGLTHATTPLEEAMSEAERAASGLHRLSQDEKVYLSEWLASRERDLLIAGDPTAPVSSTEIRLEVQEEQASFGLEQIEPPVIAAMKGRLRGRFEGWQGDTKFRLDNGQVWQQRVGGQYNAPRRTQPEVVIEKGRFGYYLRVVETGRLVGVKRIK